MKATTILTMIGVFIFVRFCELTAQIQYQTLKQPDGTTFKAIEVGDEWLHFFETPEGYIVHRGPDGFFQYLNITAAGDFVSTGLRTGIDVPANVPVRPYNLPEVQKALKQKIEAYNAAAETNRQRFLRLQRGGSSSGLGKNSNIAQSTQIEITINMGVLLVEFTGRPHHTDLDHPNGYSTDEFEMMLFSDDQYISPAVSSPDGEQVFGSMRDYFEFQSHGLLHLTGQVINPNTNGIPTWLNMGSTAPYDTQGESRYLLRDAINQAIALGWNCNYDIVGVLVSQDDWTWYAGGIAWFQNDYSSSQFSPSFDFANWFGGFVFNERNAAEYRDSNQATFSHIGLIGHEVFHVLGWGIYNILGEGGLIHVHAGQGDWSFMNMGYRTGPLRKDECPGDLDAVARVVMEWASPTQINADLLNEPIQYLQVDNNPTANFDFYQFNDPAPGSTQQFIVENRQYSGFNAYLPEWWKSGSKGGLLVWWRNGQNRDIRRADNDNDVVLEGMPHVSDGDLGDPFPGSSNNLHISMATSPNTNNSTGNQTGFAITNISSSATTMTATFRKSYLTSNSTDATAGNGQRKLARESNGTYHLVFETGGEVYYQKSTDGGSSWTDYRRLSSGNGNNRYPCIAERSGNLYVVWQRQSGSSHNIHYRSFASGSWGTIQTLASSVGTNAPLPAIVASVPAHSLDLMVVYRGSNGLKYRRYTGGSWQAVATVNGTTSASRNPSLVYKSNDYGYFDLTWDDDSNIYHQIFYGSSWGTATRVSSQILPAHNHQYSSYALPNNLDRHIVWQAFEAAEYQRQVIYHNKNLNSTIFTMFVTPDWDYLRPTGSGHSGGAFTVAWHDASSSKNILKAYYNGSYWESSPSVIASNGTDASLSVANPPGATAKAVWRSVGTSPYVLTVGPWAGLGKSAANETFAYSRRAVYSLDTTAVFVLQMSAAQIISGRSNSALPFPEVADDDSLVAAQLAGKMSLSNILLPADADSLVFTVHTYSREAGDLRQNSQLPLQVTFVLSPVTVGATPVSVSLAPVVTKGEGRQAMRLAFPVQTLRGQMVNLQTVLNNLDVDKSQGVLMHVYEVIESGASKSGGQPTSTTIANEHELRLHIYPNPFNPSTQIRFTMKNAGMVALRIYNLQGQLVRELLHEHRIAGEHIVQWDGRDNRGVAAASGVYFIRFESGNEVKLKKVMLVR